MSCILGTAPLIDVSGTLKFRGGGEVSRDCGRYAVEVTSFLFVGNRPPKEDVKWRVARAETLEGTAADLKTPGTEVARGSIAREETGKVAI